MSVILFFLNISASARDLGIYCICVKSLFKRACVPILTHTSNAKCFRNVTLIKKRGLAEIIVPFRGQGRHSPKQVMIKRE